MLHGLDDQHMNGIEAVDNVNAYYSESKVASKMQSANNL